MIALIALTSGFCFGSCPQYDLTGDCWVNLEDLALLASEWMSGNRKQVPNLTGLSQTEAKRAIINSDWR